MLRFILSRIGGTLAVLALVAVMVFALTRLASGDPIALLLGDQATAEDIAQARVQYGLDKPLLTQFGYWVKEIAQGNLGQSIFLQRPVTQALAERAEVATLANSGNASSSMFSSPMRPTSSNAPQPAPSAVNGWLGLATPR